LHSDGSGFMVARMEFLDFGHDPFLVATSFVVALVAGTTGLSLTKDLSRKSVEQRKLSVALAAVALGGGIWSMHFIAMLGLRLPIPFYYDAAITLVSALVAILVVAVALVLLHFRPRTRRVVALAGGIVGLGILAMHYIGMAGMQLCRAVHTPFGVIGSSVLAIGLCIVAFDMAYRVRTNRNIAFGAACFGAAVFAVHFLAMAGTGFVALPEVREFGPTIGNETLAIGVILSSFAIFGAFLWVGATFSTPAHAEAPRTRPAPPPMPEPGAPVPRIPCEREGAKVFLAAGAVAFVRADGHYTQVYTPTERYFCVWSITEAARRLAPDAGFLKVHRSYLVNPSKVARFERGKDKGRCRFDADALPPVPVSRAHLKDASDALGRS